MKASKLTGVVVYLRDDDVQKLRDLAKKEDRTLSSLVRTIITARLKAYNGE